MEPMSIRRYNYRLRPGAVATQALIEEWHRTRFLWNRAVATLDEEGRWLTDADITALRAELDWFGQGSVVVQQQELRNFKTKRGHRRKFKVARKTHPSLQYTKRGFSISDGRLRLAKMPPIPVVWSRELPSEPSSVRVFREPDGHWYVSFVVEVEDVALPEHEAGIGIDWGVKTLATTTDAAFDLAHPNSGMSEVKRQQRKLSRRERGSRAWRATRKALAREHRRVARRRTDTAHKWSKSVVEHHGTIGVEDFRPKFLAKSTMARKAADAAISATKTILVTRAAQAGRKVVLVPPAYTTMTCSACHSKAKSRLPLDVRIFRCECCGYTDDRDRNAARVILVRAGFNPAGVDDVRLDHLRVAEQSESGIPRL